MDLILIAISRLVHAPLIDCGCRQTFLHPSQVGCATNAHQRAAPQSLQERNVAIVMNDAARSVGCASLSQDGLPRLRNGAQTPAPASGGSTCPPDTIG
jgi:hypothetical protein